MDSDQPQTETINKPQCTDSNRIPLIKIDYDESEEILFLEKQIDNLKEEKNQAQTEFQNMYDCLSLLKK